MSAKVPISRTVHTGSRNAAELCVISTIKTLAPADAQMTIMSYMSRR